MRHIRYECKGRINRRYRPFCIRLKVGFRIKYWIQRATKVGLNIENFIILGLIFFLKKKQIVGSGEEKFPQAKGGFLDAGISDGGFRGCLFLYSFRLKYP